MSFKKQVVSPEEKYMQQQLQLEREFYSIRKEYCVLDQDRERSQLHGTKKLEKGYRVFEIFKQEYKNLKTDLEVATTLEKKRLDSKQFDHLNRLLIEHDLYEKAVDAEKTYMKEVEEQIKIVRKSVQELGKNQVTDRQYEERLKNARRTIALLENNLETQIKKFNVVCTKNRDSREQIDHLLWDRRNFMNVWSKIINKLATGKKIMMDLIEQATIAYDQREDWCNKLQVLRMKGHKELHANMEDMRELKRKQCNFKKLETFFNIKSRKRRMLDLELKHKQKRMELQVKLKDKLISQQQMLEEIMTFCNERDQETIAQKYYNQEAENFMLFTYLNDLLAEMEILGDQLTAYYIEIEEQNTLKADRAFQQETKISALENRLNQATKNTTESEDDLNTLNSNLEEMMQKIFYIFKMCRCDQDPILKLLGDNSTIKDYNVLLYLEVLEKTIYDILIRVAYNDRLKYDKKKASSGKSETIISSDYKVKMEIYPIDKIVKSTPCALCVEHELVSDVIDVLQVVWKKNFIKQKIQSGLKKSEIQDTVHNTSRCQLPKARQIMQKRYE